MAYKSGDLEAVYECKELANPGSPDEFCECEDQHPTHDSREEYKPNSTYIERTLKTPLCYLPHSCDYWVIGGVEEAKAMIVDLKAFIASVTR